MKIITILLLFFSLISCSSTIDLTTTNYSLLENNYSQAFYDYSLKENEIRTQQGDIIYNLDIGLLAHYDRQYSTSNEYLTKSENHISNNFTQSISANISTFLINDNMAKYQGEDYEDLYINIFKALNYYHLGNIESAMVELRRLSEKQSLLEIKYNQQLDKIEGNQNDYFSYYNDEFFSSSALSHYLSMIFSRELKDENTFNLSKRLLLQTFINQNKFYPNSLPEFIEKENFTIEKNLARLNFLAFNGIIPSKEEKINSFYTLQDRISIAYPVMPEYYSIINKVKITIDDKSFYLEKIEKLSHIAKKTFEPKQAISYNKSVARALAKYTITEVATITIEETTKDENGESIFADIFDIITTVTNNITERADIRSSHFLPAVAWSGGLNLPYGIYDIKVEYFDYYNHLVQEINLKDYILDENNAYLIESFCPL